MELEEGKRPYSLPSIIETNIEYQVAKELEHSRAELLAACQERSAWPPDIPRIRGSVSSDLRLGNAHF